MNRILAIILGLVTGLSYGVRCAGEIDRAQIRQFDIPTLERLGQELHRRDSLAATATDLLFEEHPDARQVSFAGWITELNEEMSRVYFLQSTEEGLRQGYVAVFSPGKVPIIRVHMNEPIPGPIKLRHLARTTAIAATSRRRSGRPHNFEVLDDPDGEGFLVYSIVATTDPNEIIIGGHARVTISKDGKRAERVDSLSRTLLVLDRREPSGGREAVGFFSTHIVSATPVETHVYLSLLHMIPLHVMTDRRSIWRIENGRIARLEIPAGRDIPPKPARRRGQ